MNSDRIEKEVLLRAPLERVWRAISDADEFGHWFGVRFDGPFVAGTSVTGMITPTTVDEEVAKAQEPHAGKADTWQIVAVEPQQRLAFRWHPYGVEADIDYAEEPTTLVEFTLEDTPTACCCASSSPGSTPFPPTVARRRSRATARAGPRRPNWCASTWPSARRCEHVRASPGRRCSTLSATRIACASSPGCATADRARRRRSPGCAGEPAGGDQTSVAVGGSRAGEQSASRQGTNLAGAAEAADRCQRIPHRVVAALGPGDRPIARLRRGQLAASATICAFVGRAASTARRATMHRRNVDCLRHLQERNRGPIEPTPGGRCRCRAAFFLVGGPRGGASQIRAVHTPIGATVRSW